MSENQQPNQKPHFLKRVWRFMTRSLRFYLMSIGLFVTVIPIITAVILSRSTIDFQEPQAEELGRQERVFLDLKLEGPVADKTMAPTEAFFGELFGEKKPLVIHDLVSGLKRASRDERVKGVFVTIKGLQISLAHASELRQALSLVKAAGKPLVMHVESPDTTSYYLASVADEIAMYPSDGLYLTGPVFQLVYVRDALAKLGVGFDLVRVGAYKSAAEHLVAMEPSRATEEMYQSLQESLVLHLLDTIRLGRKQGPEVVRQWIQRSFFSAEHAKTEGLIDQVAYRQAYYKSFEERFENTRAVKFHKYLPASQAEDERFKAEGSQKIGLIEAHGPVLMRADGSHEPQITVEGMLEQIEWMAEQDDVVSVVVRLSSPGGSATASEIIWQALDQLNQKKPVIISMGSVVASGGYYIAAAGRTLVSSATTVTGSIGVFTAIAHAKAAEDKWGVNFHVISASQRRNFFDLGESLSSQDREVLQAHTNDIYELFLKRVMMARQMERDAAHERAQGRVYTGAQAFKLGLVDKIGGFQEALHEAKTAASLNPDKLYRLVRYQPKAKSAFDCFGREGEELWQCLAELEAVLPALSRVEFEPKELKQVGEDIKSLWLISQDDKFLALEPGFLRF